MAKLLFKVFIALLCTASLCACGKDDEPLATPDNDGIVDPSTPVKDPAGTVILSMRNDDDATRLDGIYIDSANNFAGAEFASIGEVNGLGNVSYIPMSGWASRVSVTPGHGYVAYKNGTYYRIYVIGYIVDTMGGIIGADIKYQAPFTGADTDIVLTDDNLIFDGEVGGELSLVFENTSIIPFTVESDADWCQVYRATTLDEDFLYNAVNIVVSPLYPRENITANVTIKALNGKEKRITITQAAARPFITCSQNTVNVGSGSGTGTMSVVSNIDIEDITLSFSDSWLEGNLVDDSSNVLQQSAAIKSVEGGYVSDGYADYNIKSYVLYFYYAANKGTERTGTITLSSTDGASQSVTVIQEGLTLSVPVDAVYFERTLSNHTIEIVCNGEYEAVSSNPEWCTLSTNGNNMTIRTTATDVDRQATISFVGFPETITVYQSKYAVGDEYDENGVKGTVALISVDGVRLVAKDLETTAQWSTETVLIGADDEYDGRNNMAVVKSIANWQELYPAFALVEALNVNGVTGWYLPAVSEGECADGEKLFMYLYESYWSSTEESERKAYVPSNFHSTGAGFSWYKYEYRKIVACHRF